MAKNFKVATNHKAQSEAFVETARALECDESEKRFDEALKKVARHKPQPESKEENHERDGLADKEH